MVPTLYQASLGRASTFVLRARDRMGNARRCARDAPFRVSLLYAAGTIDVRIAPLSDGTFLVRRRPWLCEP